MKVLLLMRQCADNSPYTYTITIKKLDPLLLVRLMLLLTLVRGGDESPVAKTLEEVKCSKIPLPKNCPDSHSILCWLRLNNLFTQARKETADKFMKLKYDDPWLSRLYPDQHSELSVWFSRYNQKEAVSCPTSDPFSSDEVPGYGRCVQQVLFVPPGESLTFSEEDVKRDLDFKNPCWFQLDRKYVYTRPEIIAETPNGYNIYTFGTKVRPQIVPMENPYLPPATSPPPSPGPLREIGRQNLPRMPNSPSLPSSPNAGFQVSPCSPPVAPPPIFTPLEYAHSAQSRYMNFFRYLYVLAVCIFPYSIKLVKTNDILGRLKERLSVKKEPDDDVAGSFSIISQTAGFLAVIIAGLLYDGYSRLFRYSFCEDNNLRLFLNAEGLFSLHKNEQMSFPPFLLFCEIFFPLVRASIKVLEYKTIEGDDDHSITISNILLQYLVQASLDAYIKRWVIMCLSCSILYDAFKWQLTEALYNLLPRLISSIYSLCFFISPLNSTIKCNTLTSELYLKGGRIVKYFSRSIVE